jgi:hypothetical protein
MTIVGASVSEFRTPTFSRFACDGELPNSAFSARCYETILRRQAIFDLLVTFAPDAPWSLFDWVVMRDELEAMFHRPVDLVEKSAIRNPFRRRAILNHHQVIYAA